MYQLTNLLEEINCDILEYAYLAERTPHNAGSFKLWIPKIMAPLPFGNATRWNQGINDIFSNAPECKISHARSISMQNYITTPRHLDTDFSMRAQSDSRLPVGQQFIVSFMNHNPRDKKILKIM